MVIHVGHEFGVLLVSGIPTLACALDAVADAYGLAVAEFLSVFHADAGVGIVLKMGHVDDCVECNVDV